jgi:meso-butanediol dehydrogenase/(S,S)-butanediol dehydrogenase/diacetyl reductase
MARAALITGGGSGIGAAAARRLARDGWLVGLIGRRPEPLQAVAAETGGHAFPGDAADPALLAHAVQALVAEAGGLHGLVCSAGAGHPGTAVEQTPQGWDAVLRVNLTAPFLAARAAIPELERTRGAVVIVSSLAGLRAGPASVAYSASKAGAIHLARCLAVDHGPQGVRANALCPGWVRTPMADDALAGLAARTGGLDAAYAEATRLAPDRRPATAEEVAESVAFLLSDASHGINGSAIPIDGGAHAVDPESAAFLPDAR